MGIQGFFLSKLINVLALLFHYFQPGVVCTYCYDPRDDTGVLKDTCEHTPGATCETHVDILTKGRCSCLGGSTDFLGDRPVTKSYDDFVKDSKQDGNQAKS